MWKLDIKYQLSVDINNRTGIIRNIDEDGIMYNKYMQDNQRLLNQIPGTIGALKLMYGEDNIDWYSIEVDEYVKDI